MQACVLMVLLRHFRLCRGIWRAASSWIFLLLSECSSELMGDFFVRNILEVNSFHNMFSFLSSLLWRYQRFIRIGILSSTLLAFFFAQSYQMALEGAEIAWILLWVILWIPIFSRVF